ncbi:MAG: 23S rRNA (pseudouridine(1915)-N(3))-methyltransferase RlmH [Candidatus Dojkabacteria bacterium]|uniref:23S rRNA (Pseudouridine(1915)-N(3))-methyltransferase RlmH n=1 Tax=Candidatus Dojkabacteria bacterium TaxID=2099670 RepID=A0A952AKF6_9BACT|nr:23S rRNA (pseudouridine(1915)-N(3))-methyltransferase RlmH [Candidatus Dojkabacteria bacterium]WKZ28079.1 MAG: 23S rRNA (pseudouridine(1915)-N(3))-methyltransferase RlmH [Candidatus Dojkabacteria bacterium]
MKRINLLLFGKIKSSEYINLFNYYLKLSSKYYSVSTITKKDPNRPIQLQDIPTYSSSVYLLTEQGKLYDTFQFSNLVNNQDSGNELTFIIASAFGFDRLVLESRYQLLSLSPMTFNHEMAAVVLVEQLFRVGNYANGGSYHK